ncbi:MAG: right-handed parallel beta-helix repeat-containing protein [Kiritimatiellae bacterium]|jgi:hypothetical protein|nr:right-handed parallel beta-helix repeat-containing protein [Kiritimatiellia bacterium]
MKTINRILTFIILTALCSRAASPELVEKVKAGKLTEARASWWGFNAEDSTDALQAAFASGAKRLIVDKQPTPWIVTSLSLSSNQEIFFEEGVEVLAKKGEFMGKGDSLFLLSNISNVTLRGYGATLRMRRDDYDAPPYKKAEWRHVLCIRGCANIKVFGLTLAESGGDGIYLGSVKGAPSNLDVHIKDVICDKNYRQGISVITAENLLIENTVMRDTAGTAPSAGIDFEPNNANERLKNVVMRNCLTSNNAGDGYEFYLPNLHKSSEPVSITIENCKSIGDRAAVRVITGNSDEDAVRGSMAFEGCEFKSSLKRGIEISRKPEYGMKLAFKQCSVVGCGSGLTNKTDVAFSSRGGDVTPVGGVCFENLQIIQPCSRPWISWFNNIFADQGVSGVSGDVVVKCDDKVKTVALTPEWLQAKFPPRFNVRVPSVDIDWDSIKVVDALKGEQPLQPLRLRRQGEYLFYAQAGVEVLLTGNQRKVGRYAVSDKPLLIKTLGGKTLKKIKMAGFKEKVSVKFTPKKTGVYRLNVDSGGNSFVLRTANVPVAFDTSVNPVGLISSRGSLYLSVAAETELFAVQISGSGDAEAVKASVFSPEGKLVWSSDMIVEVDRFTANHGEGQKDGLWRIKLDRPSEGCFEDFHVSALGAPGFLFLNSQRIWTAQKK